MTSKTDFQKKIESLEEQKKDLIEKRYNEITAIIKKLDALPLDNNLIMGAICYAKSIHEKNDKAKIEELEKYIPSRFRKTKKSAKK